MIRIALYGGSFDPPTRGHLDMIHAGLCLADKLVLAVGIHHAKTPFFSFSERVDMLHALIKAQYATYPTSLDIVAFDGLLIDKAQEIGAKILIRGLRDGSDFDYEMKLAGMNRALAPDIETIFIPARAERRHITSTLVRQIVAMGGDVSPFVPREAETALRKKFQKDRG